MSEPLVGPGAGNTLRVYLVAIEPGVQIASRFGHSALWIEDSGPGPDRIYNFGRSDLRQPGFLRQMLLGKLDSRAIRSDPNQELFNYIRMNRSVWTQELNLSPTQRVILRDHLDESSHLLSGVHRYDPYRENCTTKIRDAIDKSLGGQLRAATMGGATPNTYRSHTRHYTTGHFPLQMALTLMESHEVDRTISAWQGMFLPQTLMDGLRDVMIFDESGKEVPLVISEETWFDSGNPPPVPGSQFQWVGHLLFGLTLGFGFGALGAAAPTARWARISFVVLGASWLAGIAMASLVLIGLWGFSDLYMTSWNQNLLQMNPIGLVASPVMVIGAFGSPRALRWARTLSTAIATLATLGVIIKLLPIFYQANTQVLVAAVPAHVGLAWGLWRWNASRADSQGDSPPSQRSGWAAS